MCAFKCYLNFKVKLLNWHDYKVLVLKVYLSVLRNMTLFYINIILSASSLFFFKYTFRIRSALKSAHSSFRVVVLNWMCVFPVLFRLKGKHTNVLSLRFTDPELETRFSVEKEKQSGAAFSCSCVVLLFTAVMEALIDPRSVNY